MENNYNFTDEQLIKVVEAVKLGYKFKAICEYAGIKTIVGCKYALDNDGVSLRAEPLIKYAGIVTGTGVTYQKDVVGRSSDSSNLF